MLPWRGSGSAVDEHAALEGVSLRCGQARCPGGGRLPLWTSTRPWRGSASAVDGLAALEGVGLCHCDHLRQLLHVGWLLSTMSGRAWLRQGSQAGGLRA